MRNIDKTFLAITASFLVGVSLNLITANAVSVDENPNPIAIPQEELSLVTEVMQQIRERYVDEIDEKKLLIGAIRGILNELDPHSSYLDPQELKRLTSDAEGKFGGLGISVIMEDGLVRVITPIDDTPAKRAGILPGDLIIRLDETEVRGMTLSEAVEVMRGKPGTSITLTIIREKEPKPLIVKIIREIIVVPSIKKRLLQADFGYVRITKFQKETADQFAEAVAELAQENNQALKGIVLDLRFNPGGLLDAAIGVSNLVLDEGLIVYTQGRSRKNQEAKPNNVYAFPGDILSGAPIVVLVNEASASASEIVAGALQDNKRAIVVGRPTFGKATVQQPIELKNGGALKLTIARYYTPSGTSIQLHGITPDVELKSVELTERVSNFTVTESNLANRLDNPEGDDSDDEAEEDDDDAEAEEEQTPLFQEDFELYEALNLLKGLSVFSRNGQSKYAK